MENNETVYKMNLSRLFNIILAHYVSSNFSGMCATIVNLTGNTISAKEAEICLAHLKDNRPSESVFPEFYADNRCIKTVGSWYWFDKESTDRPKSDHMRANYLRALIHELNVGVEETRAHPIKKTLAQKLFGFFATR